MGCNLVHTSTHLPKTPFLLPLPPPYYLLMPPNGVISSPTLIAYCAQNMPIDDTSLVGGAINAFMRLVFADLTLLPTDQIEAVSDSTSDTAIALQIGAITTAGILATQTRTLEGLDPIDFDSVGPLDHLESAVLVNATTGTPTAAVGNVTVRIAASEVVFAIIPAGEYGFRRFFQGSVAGPTLPKPYWEKFFWKNTNTLTLYDAQIYQYSDPTGFIVQSVSAATNDSATSSNRLTAPAQSALAPPAPTTESNVDDVPGGLLHPGDAIGVWLTMTLPPGSAPVRNIYQSEAVGAFGS